MEAAAVVVVRAVAAEAVVVDSAAAEAVAVDSAAAEAEEAVAVAEEAGAPTRGRSLHPARSPGPRSRDSRLREAIALSRTGARERA